MKRFVLLSALVTASVSAAPAPVDTSGFVPVAPDYKRPVEVPNTFFNPFKIQALADAETAKLNAPAVSNEAVLTGLGQRGLSGLLLGEGGARNRVIIGDEVFAVGDELQFASGDKDPAPLVTGASVVLRSVEKDKLTLEVTPAGESPRTLTYLLRAFWRP